MAIVYLYVRQKIKRRLNAFFRLLIILSICVITVYLFPKVGSFQYEYQKGMPWRYETLTAPFDFPIHKTEDELQEEREKLVQEQSPIFILNTNTADLQTGKFRTALHAFRNETTSGSLNKLTDRSKISIRPASCNCPKSWMPGSKNH